MTICNLWYPAPYLMQLQEFTTNEWLIKLLSDHILGRHCQELKMEAWSLNKTARNCTLLQIAIVNTTCIVMHFLGVHCVRSKSLIS